MTRAELRKSIMDVRYMLLVRYYSSQITDGDLPLLEALESLAGALREARNDKGEGNDSKQC